MADRFKYRIIASKFNYQEESRDNSFSYDSSSRLTKRKNDIGLKRVSSLFLAYTFRQRHSREKERRLQWNLEEKEFGSISFVDAFVRNLASNEDLLSWKNVGTLKSPLYKENIQFHVFCRISLSRSRGNIKSIFLFLHPSPPTVPRNA